MIGHAYSPYRSPSEARLQQMVFPHNAFPWGVQNKYDPKGGGISLGKGLFRKPLLRQNGKRQRAKGLFRPTLIIKHIAKNMPEGLHYTWQVPLTDIVWDKSGQYQTHCYRSSFDIDDLSHTRVICFLRVWFNIPLRRPKFPCCRKKHISLNQ